MAFMRPEIIGKQEWAGVETTAGFWWVPIDVLTKSELESARRGDFEPLLKYTEGSRVYSDQSSIKKGYGVRLSAPGYMDSTDWEVYGSKEEALKRARQLAKEAEGEDYATMKKSRPARSHSTKNSTKKSPAQLEREIAEALKGRSSHHHSTMSDDEKIRAAIAKFPPAFEMRGFPGAMFRLSPTSSYISGGRVVLYAQRKDGNQWLDFAKGSESELRREVIS